MKRLATALVCAWLAACTGGNGSPDDSCESDDDCPAGRYCSPANTCNADCASDDDCSAPGAVCSVRGQCVGGDPVDAGSPCASDADCDDGAFCNGAERCDPSSGGADGCVPGTAPCTGTCDEAADTCDDGCAEGDADGDGVDSIECGGTDCDDDDASRFPGALEICNDRDEDCDATTLGDDGDGDGYPSVFCCNPTDDGVACGRDCNDGSAEINPEAPESCNGVDDDCDGSVDEGVLSTYYRDDDGDGHGQDADTMTACAVPTGYVTVGGDCDDTDPGRNPGTAEVCDVPARDNDCDGTVDEGVKSTFYVDSDGDGFGANGGGTIEACRAPEGFVANDQDCNDTTASASPLRSELCGDTIDNDCDDLVDESGARTFYRDSDGDEFGSAFDTVSTTECAPPDGYVDVAGDCNDTDEDVYPGAPEPCDRVDNNCSLPVTPGGVDAAEDADEDGHAPVDQVCEGGPLPKDDCDDTDATVYAGAPELCDRRDNDCSDDGLLDASEDMDNDGFAPIGGACEGGPRPETDCDDGSATTYPGAPEACNDVDDDCDATVDEVSADADCGDGMACVASLCLETTPLVTAERAACRRIGSGSLRCWCDGNASEVVTGTGDCPADPFLVADIDDAVRISGGYSHMCAVRRTGGLWCWGSNSTGQLGDGLTESRGEPRAVAGLPTIVDASAGFSHTCAVSDVGGVLCWGANDRGQLGDGTTTDRLTPTPVVDLPAAATQVSVEWKESCARFVDGRVACWGAQYGSTLSRRRPVLVEGLTGAVSVHAGQSHSCALQGSGQVRCWGRNTNGQLGAGFDPGALSTVTGIDDAVSLGTGATHNCAVRATGEVLCWGGNDDARDPLGVESPEEAFEPILLEGLMAVNVSAAYWTTCVTRTDGGISCWGMIGSVAPMDMPGL